MALSATPYKMDLNLTDLDRHVFAAVRFTVARHPSETEQRMCARLISHVLWYSDTLAFGRGLSDVDEPALWDKHLDGRIHHWIEVGLPDADRLVWSSRRAEQVSLLAYGRLDGWESKVLPGVANLKNLQVAALPQDGLDALAQALPRSIHWAAMLCDGALFITDHNGQHDITPRWLKAADRP